jgi:hypothetical protein
MIIIKLLIVALTVPTLAMVLYNRTKYKGYKKAYRDLQDPQTFYRGFVGNESIYTGSYDEYDLGTKWMYEWDVQEETLENILGGWGGESHTIIAQIAPFLIQFLTIGTLNLNGFLIK